jgi:hypothetical protein
VSDLPVALTHVLNGGEHERECVPKLPKSPLGSKRLEGEEDVGCVSDIRGDWRELRQLTQIEHPPQSGGRTPYVLASALRGRQGPNDNTDCVVRHLKPVGCEFGADRPKRARPVWELEIGADDLRSGCMMCSLSLQGAQRGLRVVFCLGPRRGSWR